jgi:hypothetical protein
MTRRREFTEGAIGLLVLACIFVAVRLFVASYVISGFFADPTKVDPAGGAVWSNLVASVVCVLVAWWRIRTRMIKHHIAALAQAARHHKDAMAHAQACHDVLAVNVRDALAGHSEAVAQALSDHHEAVKATLAAVPPANVTNHFHAAPVVAEAEPAVVPEPAPVPARAAPKGKGRM